MPEPLTIKQPNANDADDVFLEAHARIEKWKAEFQTEWYRPQTETAAKMLWGGMPEEARNLNRQVNPKESQMMDDLMQKSGR